MDTTKISNRLLVAAPKDHRGSAEIGQLRSLILELMKPRTVLLQRILLTQMLPLTPDDFDNPISDWWPDYELYSNSHAITDINGLLVYTMQALRGIPGDLKTIAEKFDYAYMASKSKPIVNKSRKYRLVASLIKDMIEFTTKFSRLCAKLIKDRRSIYDRALATRDNVDRTKVKFFDEKSLVQVQHRITSLRNFIQQFCELFEIPMKIPEESYGMLNQKLSDLGRLLAVEAKAKIQS